ncbi:MAG: universal stress protein [Candidatus Dormiibacterota bacterium]
MFEKIVVAIDGSTFSDAAVRAAAGLAAKAGSQVEVVHVHEHDVIPAKASVAPDLETTDEARALVATALAKLKESGVDAHGRLLQSPTRDVPHKILEVADETGADLIVVGSRGLSSIAGMLLGSVSNKLIHTAKVGVMVAH